MNKEEPYRDQAERLRQKVQKLNEEGHIRTEGSLPPRSKVHQNNKKKTKIKLKYPVIRLLVLFFILLPIVIYSIYTLNQEKANQAANIENNEQDSTVEHVQVEDDAEEEQKIEKKEDTVDEEENVPEVQPEENSVEKKEELDNVKVEIPEQQNNEQIELSEKDKPKDEFLYHKVQPNDTLYSISKKYYHSGSGVDKIKRANGLKTNEIYVGQTLKIPAR